MNFTSSKAAFLLSERLLSKLEREFSIYKCIACKVAIEVPSGTEYVPNPEYVPVIRFHSVFNRYIRDENNTFDPEKPYIPIADVDVILNGVGSYAISRMISMIKDISYIKGISERFLKIYRDLMKHAILRKEITF